MKNSSEYLKRTLILSQFVFIVLLSISAVKAQISSIDLSFNALPSKNSPGNFAIQPDGKVIIFGQFQVVNGVPANRIARLNTDGSLDNSFNCTACDFFPMSVVVQPDGKSIVAGIMQSNRSARFNSIIRRFNYDGSQDFSFTSPFALSIDPTSTDSESNYTEVSAIQFDGRILIKKTDYPITGSTQISSVSILRLNSDGTLDNTFMLANPDVEQIPNQYNAKVLPLPNGKILVSDINVGIVGNSFLRRYNYDGSLDTTFEAPTLTNSNSSSNLAVIRDFDVQADGSILIVGNFTSVDGVNRLNFAKLTSEGNVDQSFVPTNVFSDGEQGNTVKILSDGQILISTWGVTTNNKIYRFNSDGSRDNTVNLPSNLIAIFNLVVDSAGRMLFYGAFFENSTVSYRNIRLNTDGSLDLSFSGSSGIFGSIAALAIQSDGKIIIGGDFEQINGVSRNKIARLNSDGSLDLTFNFGRIYSADFEKIIIQPDGKILIAGIFSFNNGTTQKQVVRFNTDGSLDSTFDLTLLLNSIVYSIALQADGKILIGGNLRFLSTGQFSTGLGRLNSDGSFDASFNPVFHGEIRPKSIFIQSDGKILVGGSFAFSNGSKQKNLVRFNSDGMLDRYFNAGNIAPVGQIEAQPDGKYFVSTDKILRLSNSGRYDDTFQSPTLNGTIRQFLVQPDGSVLVNGGNVNNLPRTGLTRLKPDGALDLSFFPGSVIGVSAFIRQRDGKILISGGFLNIANVQRVGIARLIVSPIHSITPFDFDGDGRADLSVFRPNEGAWYFLQSSDNVSNVRQFGSNNDFIAPADYDGDGKTDIAVFRGGIWYIQRTTLGFVGISFGTDGDYPVPADYDGDGKADIAVYRPSNSSWHRLNSYDGRYVNQQFGITEDKPVVADYDGDGKADTAVFRPSNGTWYLQRSSLGVTNIAFGALEDKPVPADYDGDGKADIAVFRPSSGTWYFQRNATEFTEKQFGISTDSPVPADYDGDGKTDVAVFRNGTWYLQLSQAGFTGVAFGAADDKPIPSAFVQ